MAVAAGNVMILPTPGTERSVVANLVRHLRPGGLLIAGFQVRRGGVPLADYDAISTEAGLRLEGRWSTWDQDPWRPEGDYAVSVHCLDAGPHPPPPGGE